MSLIAGIFVGHITRTQGSLGYPPLDESHNPFKRSDERPGGPKRRYDHEAKKWECTKQKPTATHTIQRCVYVGPPKQGVKPGKVKTVRRSKAKMKRYNKAYHKHLKSIAKPGLPKHEKFKNEFQPDYRKKYAAPKVKSKKKAAAKKK